MLRTKSARGISTTIRSPSIRRQLSFISASLNLGRCSLTNATLSSKVRRISSWLAGSGKRNWPSVNEGLSWTMRRMPEGLAAICSASWPAVNDFWWGFQVSLSAGTRSRNLRVMGACISNSARKSLAMDTIDLQGLCGGAGFMVCLRELFFLCADTGLIEHVSPALVDALAMLGIYEAETRMDELDERLAVLVAQTVLYIIRHRVRHE